MAEKIRVAVEERLAEGASGIEILEEVISALKNGLTEECEVKKCESETINSKLANQVTVLIHEIGIPAHLLGYRYLRDAIMYLLGNEKIITSVTKDLYPQIANMHSTLPNKVERAIRNAIEVACDRGNVDVLNNIFGYTINSNKGKPTNSEFIAMLADHIRIKYDLF